MTHSTSTTPLTDAAIPRGHINPAMTDYVTAQFARQLETQLQLVTAKLELEKRRTQPDTGDHQPTAFLILRNEGNDGITAELVPNGAAEEVKINPGDEAYPLYIAPDQAPVNPATEKNATRYSWLRSRDQDTIYQGGIFAGKTPDNIVLTGHHLDDAIDRAMSDEECQQTH